MSKTLIAYFSHAGQNYGHGKIIHLEKGNTEVVAEKIQSLVGGDLFYIDTVKKYPEDHIEKINVAKEEFNQDARPALKEKVKNMDGYEIIYLGFPNWWTTMPMALFTFLESYDFSGKTIYPFITHGGSGFSNSIEDIKRLAPGAKVEKGLAIHGDDVQNSDSLIKKWIQNHK